MNHEYDVILDPIQVEGRHHFTTEWSLHAVSVLPFCVADRQLEYWLCCITELDVAAACLFGAAVFAITVDRACLSASRLSRAHLLPSLREGSPTFPLSPGTVGERQ